MAGKPNTTASLDRARADLAAVEGDLSAMQAKRQQRLLAGDTASAISKIDLELEALQQAKRTETDRITAFEEQAKIEAAEAVRLRHQQHVDEFEKVLEQADAKGDELQATVVALEANFREVIRLRELALSMWPHGRSSHGDALAKAPEGAAMAAGAVAVLLANEIHRVGFEAPLGGRPGERVKVPLPGGVPARLTPEVDRRTGKLVPLVPLAEKLRKASAFAVSTLREDLFVPAVVPQPPVPIQVLGVEQPTPAPTPAPSQAPAPVPAPSAGNTTQEFIPAAYREKLAALLRLQMRAAANGDDAAYEKAVSNMVALRAEIDAARDGEKAA